MSAFSRGCIKLHSATLNSSRNFLLTSPKSCPTPRFFTSTSLCRSTARKPMAMTTPKPKSKPQPKPNPKVATQSQSPALVAADSAPRPPKILNYHTYADILAAKPHTTILYQAPSHVGYITTSYLAGFFLMGFAGLTCTFTCSITPLPFPKPSLTPLFSCQSGTITSTSLPILQRGFPLLLGGYHSSSPVAVAMSSLLPLAL